MFLESGKQVNALDVQVKTRTLYCGVKRADLFGLKQNYTHIESSTLQGLVK